MTNLIQEWSTWNFREKLLFIAIMLFLFGTYVKGCNEREEIEREAEKARWEYNHEDRYMHSDFLRDAENRRNKYGPRELNH